MQGFKKINFNSNWMEWFEKIQKAIRPHHLILAGKILTVFLISYYLADTGAILIEKLIPEPPAQTRGKAFQLSQVQRKIISDYDSIANRNLFNRKGLIPGEGEDNIDTSGVAVRSSLSLQLLGTVVLSDPKLSLATLQNSSENKIYAIRQNEEIERLLKVISIEPSRITFVNQKNKRLEYLDLPEDVNVPNPVIRGRTGSTGLKISKEAENSFQISKSKIQSLLTDPDQYNTFLRQARAIEHYENGQFAGYKLIQIVPDSLYGELGFQNGDIIKEINGEKVTAARAFQMLSEIGSLNEMNMVIERNGKKTNFNYEVNE